MKFVDLFPTVILQETLNIPYEVSNQYKNIIISEKMVGEGSNGSYTVEQRILDKSPFSYLKLQILKLSKIYLTELGHKFQDIQITSSWGNVLQKQNSIHSHHHTNSYICGVFYLDNSSPLTFLNPQLESWGFVPEFKDDSSKLRKQQQYFINPLKNDLIIFPSWLKHRVSPTSQEQRISIAFNIIPKGEFGHPTQKLYLK